MYWVRLLCPQDSTNRSRPGQCGSLGSCRITFWYSRYAAGARLIAVPGWPLPVFCTASIAKTRTVSTDLRSRSVHSSWGTVTTEGVLSGGGPATAVVARVDKCGLPATHRLCQPILRPHDRFSTPAAGRFG